MFKTLEKLMISISEDWISCSRINESGNDSMHNVYDNRFSISYIYNPKSFNFKFINILNLLIFNSDAKSNGKHIVFNTYKLFK